MKLGDDERKGGIKRTNETFIHSFKRSLTEHLIKSGTVLNTGAISPRRVQSTMQVI